MSDKNGKAPAGQVAAPAFTESAEQQLGSLLRFPRQVLEVAAWIAASELFQLFDSHGPIRQHIGAAGFRLGLGARGILWEAAGGY